MGTAFQNLSEALDEGQCFQNLHCPARGPGHASFGSTGLRPRPPRGSGRQWTSEKPGDPGGRPLLHLLHLPGATCSSSPLSGQLLLPDGPQVYCHGSFDTPSPWRDRSVRSRPGPTLPCSLALSPSVLPPTQCLPSPPHRLQPEMIMVLPLLSQAGSIGAT